MSEGPETRRQASERPRRLAELAEALGIEMPPFTGPLVAFQLDGARGAEDPVYLGGDLHAVHTRAGSAASSGERDASLDFATVTVTDHEQRPLDVAALEGVWCTRFKGARLAAALYLSVIDSEGRTRAWLLLPPPRLMVGIAHFWLPRLKPPPFPGDDHLLSS